MYDVIIKNGTVVDGSISKSRKEDVAIVGDEIVEIGELKNATAKFYIDATGKVVSPGFIDTHSHSDLHVFAEPFISPKIMQGVTTEVIGQDGMSLAPIKDEYIISWKKAMSGLEGEYEVDWTWRTVDDYLSCLEDLDLGPNIAFLAPHGNIRLTIMGLDDREPTLDELKAMENLLERSIEEGAFGMSTGMIYPPCCFAKTDEFIALGKILKKKDAVFVTHQRSEADYILESMDEIFTIGRGSGCKTHFSHFKVAGKKNWDKLPKVFEKLDTAQSYGIVISYDQYPYVAGSTMLGAILPPWVHDGGTEKLLERLKNPEIRERIKKDILNGIPGWDNFIEFAGLDGIYITFVKSERNRKLVGKNLVEIAEIKKKDPYEAAFDLLIEEENVVGMVDFYGTEEHVVEIMRRKEHNVCTDGIMGSKPHPRLYGTYPRILGRYVREKKVLDLETAIYKMTGKASEMLGIRNRGFIKKGYAADIVVFDAETIIDTADYDDPIQYPKGIEYVLVNGKVMVENGKPKPQKAGKVLRYEGR